MREVTKIFLIFVLMFLANCDDNPTESEDNNFIFAINVIDKNSNRLSNVNVSTWNKIQKSSSYLPKTHEYSEIQATTSIEFSLKQKCNVNLSIYDLEGNVFSTLIDNITLMAGFYRYQFLNKNNIGTGVFKCKLSIKEDSLSNPIIFTDSIYSVILSPDPIASQIGSTTSNGKFSTTNRLLFPNLYELPELILTGEGGPEQLATFSISDEIIIALTNSNSETKYFEKILLDEKNEFTLDWDKGSDEYPSWGWNSFQKNNMLSKIVDDTSAIVPNNFKLYQNYPNPFN